MLSKSRVKYWEVLYWIPEHRRWNLLPHKSQVIQRSSPSSSQWSPQSSHMQSSSWDSSSLSLFFVFLFFFFFFCHFFTFFSFATTWRFVFLTTFFFIFHDALVQIFDALTRYNLKYHIYIFIYISVCVCVCVCVCVSLIYDVQSAQILWR